MLTLQQANADLYQRLGLQSGLEIHQQLKTDRKLFCRCPAGRYSPRFDAEILRHMRPTLSELGQYDPTALMEFKTRKEILYRLNRDSVCTYEMDDAPPFALNQQALDIALEITMLLGCKVVGELHIARKQYLDGSIPTGFQRTTILGVDGAIPFGERTVRIRQLGLEEDSCREVSDHGHRRVYMTDRLSIPLIEMVTEPDMHTPQEVAQVAEILRRLTRQTGQVRTGHGAARQDVNVSIRGGTRCEIKGVHSIRNIAALVHYEALRQKALLDIGHELHCRGLKATDFAEHAQVEDVTKRVRHSLGTLGGNAKVEGSQVLAVRLPKFRGILTRHIGPQRRFEHEIADRVRVVACLDWKPNMLHAEDFHENLAPRLWDKVMQAVGATENDAVVLVWGPQRDARTAAEEVVLRAREAIEGVPRETRQALPGGETGFERILPGPDRMYPDTDLPPIALEEARLARVRAALPKLPWVVEQELAALGLNSTLRRDLLRSGRMALFERIRSSLPVDPQLVCVVLAQQLKALQRTWSAVPQDEQLFALFELFAQNRFGREAFAALLLDVGQHPERSVEHTVEARIVSVLSDSAVHEEVGRLLSAAHWSGARRPDMVVHAAMGHVMANGLRGRALASAILAAVRQFLERAEACK